MANVGPEPAHEATGTFTLLLGVQVVVIQLSPPFPGAAAHDDTPVGPVVRIGQVVVV